MNEVWKQIKGFEGAYEVSDHGQVRSFKSKASPAKVLKQGWKGAQKYKVVVLRKNGVSVHSKVHHLVLDAFSGPCPQGMEGCHNNGKNTDNRFENLRWDTHKSNVADQLIHGTRHASQRKKSCGRVGRGPQKLTEEIVKKILVDTRRYQDIADDFGVGYSSIAKVKTGFAWKHVSRVSFGVQA